jgi:hypothetical protein
MRLGGEGHFEHLLEFVLLVHFNQDVGAAEEFSIHVDLRDSRPVRVFLDALTHFLIGQHIKGLEGHAELVENLDNVVGEAALGHELIALHEDHDFVVFDELIDACLSFHGGYWGKGFAGLAVGGKGFGRGQGVQGQGMDRLGGHGLFNGTIDQLVLLHPPLAFKLAGDDGHFKMLAVITEHGDLGVGQGCLDHGLNFVGAYHGGFGVGLGVYLVVRG